MEVIDMLAEAGLSDEQALAVRSVVGQAEIFAGMIRRALEALSAAAYAEGNPGLGRELQALALTGADLHQFLLLAGRATERRAPAAEYQAVSLH